MRMGLTGRRALVMGASRGIGRACAEELARLGASVTVSARDERRLEEVVSKLDTGHGQGHALEIADLCDPDVVERQFGELFDARPVEILVNNTGGPPPGPIVEARAEDFLAGMRAHLVCNQHLVRAALPGMRAAGYGRVVNIISTSVKEPLPGLGVSNTVRGAVASWAKTISSELAPDGITVNNVLPGFTDTDRLRSLIAARAEEAGTSLEAVAESMRAGVPMGRFGDASEVAAAVAFFASPAASYITGVSLAVDGGRTRAL